jgi:hypothetical protein
MGCFIKLLLEWSQHGGQRLGTELACSAGARRQRRELDLFAGRHAPNPIRVFLVCLMAA